MRISTDPASTVCDAHPAATHAWRRPVSSTAAGMGLLQNDVTTYRLGGVGDLVGVRCTRLRASAPPVSDRRTRERTSCRNPPNAPSPLPCAHVSAGILRAPHGHTQEAAPRGSARLLRVQTAGKRADVSTAHLPVAPSAWRTLHPQIQQ